jgi:hypothetical protein
MEGHFLNTIYLLTNDKSNWLDFIIARLRQDHSWKVVTSHDIVYGDAQEMEVGMAIDMELARRSAVFIGNGVCSLPLRSCEQWILTGGRSGAPSQATSFITALQMENCPSATDSFDLPLGEYRHRGGQFLVVP